MLKSVEIIGFKSFADRTRFEFGDGITAIVGPNGSGKSNIVDAVKWVLGEQSMKKLRSQDATDVIFSGTVSRPPAGAAEVSLTFDNAKKIFNIDAPEVHFTRRVYRSGEGEYLINRQASRLKYFKDLLSGTGLGTQAYSIIEQGRVESLLQTSAVQRRVIFDDAAGISRFNAQKQEIQRRYERVKANLLRLADIKNGVEQQLKHARGQAGKARQYQQHKERLQTLRIESAQIKYRQQRFLYEKLQSEIAEQNEAAEKNAAAVNETENNLAAFNADVEQIDIELRRFESGLAAVRQKIAGEENTIESQFLQIDEIDREIAGHRQQMTDWASKNAGIEEQIRKMSSESDRLKRQTDEAAESYQALSRQESVLAEKCQEQQRLRDHLRKDIETKNKQNVKLAGAVSGLESRLTALQAAETNDAAKLGKIGKQNADWQRQCEELHDAAGQLEKTVQQKAAQLEEAKKRKQTQTKQLTELTKKLSLQKQKQSGLKERSALLEELIRKHEGISPGVREVLLQSRDPKSPFRHVFGLVADLLIADYDTAPLIDLALGVNSQHVVVSPEKELFRHIEKNAGQFAGRVGFIWLDPTEQEAAWMSDAGFAGRAGVLGRADQFVQNEPKFDHLAKRLLGRIWIVKDLAAARKLYRESDDRTSFLTVSGEMLTPDGSLIVGPKNTAGGLMTRRSELRTLNEQIAALDAEVSETEMISMRAADDVGTSETEVEEETREHQKAVTEYESAYLKRQHAEERYRQGVEQYHTLESEIGKIKEQIVRTEEELKETKTQRESLDEQLVALDIQFTENTQTLEEAERTYHAHRKRTTDMKVEWAKSGHRLESLHEQIRQFGEQLTERQTMLTEHRQRSRTLIERRDNTLLGILRIESALAAFYLQKEELSAAAASVHEKRSDIAAQRTKLQTELKRQQHELQKIRTKIHTGQIESERCSQEQKQIIDRIREDYGADITVGDPQTADENIGDYQKEIEDLRSKLSRLGNVNLEAMETLDQLEKQYKHYSVQYEDCISAMKLTEKLIEDVDRQNKTAFEETFNGVRSHFQTLFQKLFGGGSADLVLDNPGNVLESGVEIIAKPPGKELKNVMLLSGGEKTLTCFALLLAFFRFKPNPVCILDECDAALDEGNVDRYNSMLKEFGMETQFLMITHSKKSMAFAQTLYGITMQDAGVSKSVSVRYVDVGDNGEILKAA
jgi:chromosome segregation protein